MPRKKGKNQKNQPVPTTTTAPCIFAKCTSCQVNKELQACAFCQYPECAECIEKHREANELAQRKTTLQTRIDHLRQQTALRDELREGNLESSAVSLDLLKSTEDNFERTLAAEYNAHEEKLKQSQTMTEQHINDLKRMWAEYNKENTSSNIDNTAEIDQILDQIEAVLAIKQIQLSFEPNTILPSLGSIGECSSNLVEATTVRTEEQMSNVQVSSSSLSSNTKAVGKVSTSDCVELNKKTMKNPSKTISASSESGCEATNIKEDDHQIVENHALEKCNQIIVSEAVEQGPSVGACKNTVGSDKHAEGHESKSKEVKPATAEKLSSSTGVQECKSPQRVPDSQLSNPKRIQIIRALRQYKSGNRTFFAKSKKPGLSITTVHYTKPPLDIQRAPDSYAGFKPIALRDMCPVTDKVYYGRMLQLTIIETAEFHTPSINLIAQDKNNDAEKLNIYNFPEKDGEYLRSVVFTTGSKVTIYNPYHRIANDNKPAIRVDDFASIIPHSEEERIKDMCRYCCTANGSYLCPKCLKALYCSKECQQNDWNIYWHELVCVS